MRKSYILIIIYHINNYGKKQKQKSAHKISQKITHLLLEMMY